jgi:hypothetical protein
MFIIGYTTVTGRSLCYRKGGYFGEGRRLARKFHLIPFFLIISGGPRVFPGGYRSLFRAKACQNQFCYHEIVWQRQAIRHGGKFVKHVVPAIIKPIHSLWNEVVGFFFLCFAAGFGLWTIRYYRMYSQAPPALASEFFMKVVLTGLVGLLMAWLGISSFLKARRISRS